MSHRTGILNCFLVIVTLSQLIPSNASKYLCDKTNCFHGVCWPETSSLETKRCYCDNGFTGFQCQVNYDDCLLNQCQNGGTCKDKVADIECICPPGYTGKFCETEINECLSAPCLFGGTCTDEINGYRCSCLPGLSGVNCQIDQSVCNETEAKNQTKCLNGGECLEGIGLNYRCQCLPGFTGDRCEINIDECESNPCYNGSQCIDGVGDFKCLCSFDRTGKRCESIMKPCETNQCQSDAICLSTSDRNETDFRCFCVPGFYGLRCERHFNECMPINLCENNGLCIDGPQNYTCSCPKGFYGKHCEIDCTSGGDDYPQCPKEIPPLIEPSYSWNPEPSSVFPAPSLTGSKPSSSYFKEISDFWNPINTPSPEGLVSVTFDVTPSPSLSFPLTSSITFEPGLKSFNFSSGDIITLDNQAESLVGLDGSYFFSPKFDGDKSYLILTSNEDKFVPGVTITFQFKSLKPSGSLVSTRHIFDEKYFILVFLDKSRLKVSFSCNSWEMILMEFPGSIEEGVFHTLTFTLSLDSHSCRANLSLNSGISITAEQSLNSTSNPPCFRDFHFGAPDPELNTFHALETDAHFQGCLKEIDFGGLGQIKKAFNIEECDLDGVCEQNPCGERGHCVRTDESWSCRCFRGYIGRRCSQASCNPDPCENDGLCMMINSNELTCLCKNGWFGNFCQLDFNKNLPAFGYGSRGSSSYMIYALPITNQSHHLELRLRFMADDLNQNNSLLLFIGNSNNIRLRGKPNDFLSLSLLRSMIIYQINLGQGTKVMVGKLNDSRVHTIYVGQHRQLAWLVVDGQKRDLEVVQSKSNRLNVEPYLYVGNHKASPLRTFSIFKGCIFDIEVRNESRAAFKPLTEVLWSSNVAECLDIHRCKG